MIRSLLKSGKTTILALLLFINVLATALYNQLDGVPETVPNWNEVINLCIVVLGLLFARDSDVSDTKAGAK